MAGVEKKSLNPVKQILFSVENQQSVGVQVGDATGYVVENGRKIMKAGTPLVGELTNRQNTFTVPTSTDYQYTQGVLLHDVDVTDGAGNGTLLIWGFVNINRIDEATNEKIIQAVKDTLKGKIWFLTD